MSDDDGMFAAYEAAAIRAEVLEENLERAEKLLEEAARLLRAIEWLSDPDSDDEICGFCFAHKHRPACGLTGWLSRYEAEKRHDG